MARNIVTTPADAAFAARVTAGEVIGFHDQLVGYLLARLGRAHADLLATPARQADGTIRWSTSLEGVPRLAQDLPAGEQAELKARAERCLGDIESLARTMQDEPGTSRLVGQMLSRVAMVPPGHWLYEVGGRPVLVMWAHADNAVAAAPPVAPDSAREPAAASLAAAATAASAASAAATGPLTPEGAAPSSTPGSATDIGGASEPGAQAVRSTPRRGGWWVPALIALLLLVAASLAWIAICGDRCQPEGSGQPSDALARELAEIEGGNGDLSREIGERLAKAPRLMCVPEAPGPGAEEATISQAPAEPESSPPSESPSRPEPPDPAPPPTPAPDPRPTNLAPPKMSALCPGERPAEKSPQLALVFDASRSMAWGLDTTESDEANFDRIPALALLEQLAGQRGAATEAQARLTGKPDRLTLARAAAVTLVRNAPADVDIGLVVLEDDCPSARSYGFVPPSRRPALVSKVQSIQATGATPLADGVQRAGMMVDGVDREALIVVVSDGTESCKGDPCAVAAALARAKPQLRINVVDILGKGAGNCLAAATRGRVFPAHNAAEVTSMMRRATANALAPDSCKR